MISMGNDKITEDEILNHLEIAEEEQIRKALNGSEDV